MGGFRRWKPAALAVVLLSVLLAGCGHPDPHLVANMPAPVRRVARSMTPSGMDLATAMLVVTGNQKDVKRGYMPGSYLYGPISGHTNIYRVDFKIPLNMAGIKQRLGMMPPVRAALAVPGENYLEIPPLNNGNFDKLYFNPSEKTASFEFQLMPNGMVLLRSWNAVTVDG